ncbi:MAG TPA: hypothetical protein VJU77_18595 [Chthoniobacterales bacterium]|nr:hypothetical protein [Chthoniobacterales bacterium]
MNAPLRPLALDVGRWTLNVGRFLFPLLFIAAPTFAQEESGYGPPTSLPSNFSITPPSARPRQNWIDQSQAAADAKSSGCNQCHQGVEPMHQASHVVLGCTDCHGGNPARGLKKEQAHVLPRNKEFWKTSANPPNSNVWLNHESAEFIRFINPGDLRVAKQACGLCHDEIIRNVDHSMMNHGAMLWGAALYNNSGFYLKNYRFGQAYGADGAPLRLINYTPVTPEDTKFRGILPFLDPLPRFNLSNPGNILRIFEKGGEKQLQLGIPTTEEPPGKPLRRLSERGLGTLNRTDPVFLGLQKTRLHDPLLGFLGSNDHAGDYRSSGCSACHVVYANDRSPTNSGRWSKYGHQGLSFTADRTIPKNERGHPVLHQFSRSIPSSQCMNCHMHQGNLFVNPYLGYTWWDQETDGELMYPKQQRNPTPDDLVIETQSNPEAAAARGLWGDREFLDKVSELNPQLKHTQFADYHGHGWVFRAIFKHDRKGNLLDLRDNKIPHDDPQKFAKAVHLKDVHLAHGMQCTDCHFEKDVHGNGMLYGEPRNATTINCIDCHGTVNQRPTLVTTGNAGAFDLLNGSNTPWGPRFVWEGTRLYQQSVMAPDVRWEIPQTIDTVDPLSSHYNPKSAYAKTLRRDGKTWGGAVAEIADPGQQTTGDSKAGYSRIHLAHDNSAMDCQICHTSWATSCFGCHLPMKANQRVPLNKFEGVTDRNYTTYNPQVVRDDVFMLGIDGTVKKNRMAVIRSSSAVVVSSQNANREWVYSQAQTFSAEGYSGQAFNPHFPHTTSGVGTTKNCTDCHLSKNNDNNAWMTQLLGFGTGTVNFFGRYSYVAEGRHGFHAVVWTEPDEPQAVIGSHLHQIAYPDNYRKHLEAGAVLKEAHEHSGHDVQDIVLRGEYLYTANGPGGFEVFDVANIDQKGFSERIVSAPVSPLGQRTRVNTKYATSVVIPSTLALDPARVRLPENEEQPIDLFYAFVYVTDREEGIVGSNVATLVDGNPDNNFLKRDVTFNPDGALTGASFATAAGHRLYVTTPRGLFVVDCTDPMHPQLGGQYTGNFLRNPHCVAIQFRYAFVTDDDGLKVLEITNPYRPVPVSGATVQLRNPGRLYVARTYAYVANGPEGLAIIDVENPERPHLDQMFNAGGLLNDTRAVQIGSVSASQFALVADGRSGLRVVQLISPDTVPGAQGFSPRPNPKLIATYPTPGEAIAVSRGLERDRVVDETGGQTVVFGRRGSRPFHLDEMEKFYLRSDTADSKDGQRWGSLYYVEDVMARNGKLMTKSGVLLNPLPTPTPSAAESPTPPLDYLPDIEPSPIEGPTPPQR